MQLEFGWHVELKELKALEIAARHRIVGDGQSWIVPSQTTATKYRVELQPVPSCTCEAFELSQKPCKHILAVQYTRERESGKCEKVLATDAIPKRPTFHQDWPAYNRAQSTEKNRLQVLLVDLCRNLQEPDRSGVRGPKPHPAKDAIFSMAMKVYCGLSSRRFSCDLLEAHEKGHIGKPISGAKVVAFFDNPAYTPILAELVAKSAAPLAVVESDFAVDSTGFGSSRYERWFDEKYGVTKQKSVWVKAHVAIGVKTNVITAVRILEKWSPDSPQFIPLLQKTAETFAVREVSGDKAYASNENFEAAADVGGTAYVPFKSNTTGGVGGLFEKMFHYFQFQRDEFLQHYHKRSNVESTFSAVKRKFGDAVMSKTDVAMTNEVLCKFLCHNLSCLIQEQETLGIVPVFWKEEQPNSERNVIRLPDTQFRVGG